MGMPAAGWGANLSPSASPPRSISAVLPAWNEEAVIGEVVTRTDAVLRSLGLDWYEVLVVDDGSRDRTSTVVGDLGLPAVRVIGHPRNLGYGSALRTGFDAARGDAVWLSDSDGQFDPEDLARLLGAYSPDTLVAGRRDARADNAVRRLNARVFFALARALLGPTAGDVDCGFKLFPRELGVGLRSRGALISTELLVRARRSGYRIADVGVGHRPRRTGAATGARPSVVLRAFGELWQLRLHPITPIAGPLSRRSEETGGRRVVAG